MLINDAGWQWCIDRPGPGLCGRSASPRVLTWVMWARLIAEALHFPVVLVLAFGSEVDIILFRVEVFAKVVGVIVVRQFVVGATVGWVPVDRAVLVRMLRGRAAMRGLFINRASTLWSTIVGVTLIRLLVSRAAMVRMLVSSAAVVCTCT